MILIKDSDFLSLPIKGLNIYVNLGNTAQLLYLNTI